MIIRSKRSQNFTVIGNDVLADARLSWAAVGVLCYLLSKPDDWAVMGAQLAKARTGYGSGREAIKKMLAELQAAGYASKKADRDAGGKITGWTWTVYDKSRIAAPEAENPSSGAEKPASGLTTCGEPAPTKDCSSTKNYLEQKGGEAKIRKFGPGEGHLQAGYAEAVAEAKAWGIDGTNLSVLAIRALIDRARERDSARQGNTG